MNKSTRETLWTFGYITLGIVAGWLTWFLLPGRKFGSVPPLLPFLILGFAGALIYAALRLRGVFYALMMVVLLFFLQLALTPPLRAESAIRAALWATPIGLSFLFAGVIFRALPRIPVGKFLLMALLVGTAHLVVVVLFRLRAGESPNRSLLIWQFLVGALIGAIFGILVEILEIVFRFRKQQEEIAITLPI